LRFNRCADGYTGTRCERSVATTAAAATTVNTKRCNYTVVLRNEGFYIARIKVVYSLDGVRQPAITSNIARLLEKTDDIVIPFESTDISVKLEKFTTFEWKLIHEDVKLGVKTECLKCYKTWGSLFKTRWDYLFC
jgi:hypothetical protein